MNIEKKILSNLLKSQTLSFQNFLKNGLCDLKLELKLSKISNNQIKLYKIINKI